MLTKLKANYYWGLSPVFSQVEHQMDPKFLERLGELVWDPNANESLPEVSYVILAQLKRNN